MIPLISSQCYGPLEICHLPRLWWKASLKAAGRLAEDYPECTPVLDSMVLDLLGLDKGGRTRAHPLGAARLSRLRGLGPRADGGRTSP